MRALLAAFALVVPSVAIAAAADPVGHYYLSGVHEMGSELLLKPDGTYQWYVTYGALDQYSAGRWQRVDGNIVLTADAKELAAFMPQAESPFATMTLRVDGDDLMPEGKPGRYSRH